MLVLGLDPGSRTTGWGVLAGDARVQRFVECGAWRPARGLQRPGALAVLAASLEELVARLAPDVVAVETPFSARHPGSALALAEARGALLATLGRWGGEVTEYEPARVKAVVTGHGRAEKVQVKYMIQRHLALASPPGEDACDALAVALCHLRCLDARTFAVLASASKVSG